MGQFRFDVPDEASEFVGQSLWQDAYICGIEGVPWQSTTLFDGSRLTITRSIDSSGKLLLACPVQNLGYRTLTTCSLRPTDKAHLLPLELARGSCYRARVQSDAWQRAGLTLSQKFMDLMSQGTQLFLDAAQRRGDPSAAAQASIQAITLLEEAIMDLGESYAVQAISFRKQREPQIGTLLAGTCLLYTSPSPRDQRGSRMPSSA